MKITWDDLSIDFSHIDTNKLMEDWLWLVGSDKQLIMISSIGDMFLQDDYGKVYWLDVGGGLIELVAENVEEFELKLKDNTQIYDWFMIELVSKIKRTGMELTTGKLYSYNMPPVLGGSYNPDNFSLIDIEVHFAVAGQILEQIKDMPDGAKVQFKIID